MADDRKEPLLVADHANGRSDAPAPSTKLNGSSASSTSPFPQPTTDTEPASLRATLRLLMENRPLFLVVCFGCLGGLLFGYDIGVMGGVIVLDGFRNSFGFPLLVQGVEDDPSTSAQLAWLVSVFPLCCACTAIVSGSLSDALSRRYSVLVGALLFTVGGGVQAFAGTTTVLLTGRVLGGFAVGILSTVVPVFIAELSAPHVRGAMSVFFQLAITIGILAAFLFNLATRLIGDSGWRWSLGMQSVLSSVLVLGIMYLPESPRWLMKKRREDEARAVLKRLRVVANVPQGQQAARLEEQRDEHKDSGDANKAAPTAAKQTNPIPADELFLQPHLVHNTLDEEVEEMRASIAQEEQNKTVAWSDLLSPALRLRMLYGCGIMVCQQLSFINAIMYFSTLIFSSVGISPLVATAVTGVVNVIATCATITYVDRVGRVPLLLTGAIGMLVSSLLVACVSSLAPVDAANASSPTWSGLLTVLFVCTHVICFAYSYGSTDTHRPTTPRAICWQCLSGHSHCLLRPLSFDVCGSVQLGSDRMVRDPCTQPCSHALPVSTLQSTHYRLSRSWMATAAMLCVSLRIVPAEIFPLGVRGKAVSITTTVNWLGSFAVGELVPSMLSAIGVGGTFYVTSASLCVCLLFVLLIGRETKGVTLERMEAVFDVHTREQMERYMADNWKRGLVLLKIRDAEPQSATPQQR